MRRFLVSACLLLTSGVVSADPLLVSQSGTWGASAPTTTWSAPSTSWSFSFVIDSSPLVSSFDTTRFIAPISDFTYVLGGASVATTPDHVTWYTSASSGLIDVVFAGATFVDLGSQAFSGSTDAPTILPGTYALNEGSHFSSAEEQDQPLTGDLVITAVPEPSTLSFLLIATGCAAAFRRRRRT